MTRRESGLEDRLRQALNVRLEDLRDGLDMSAAAVTARLRDACEASALALALVAIGERR